MKTRILIITALMILPVLLFTAPGCSKNQAEENNEKKEEVKPNIVKLSPEAVKEISLKVTPASEEEMTGEITIPCVIRADQDNEAFVGSFIEGRASRVLARPGDHVKKGQILMYVEGMEAGEIKAGFIKAKAALEFAESSLKRQQQLNEQLAGSQKSLSEARSEYNQAFAAFNAEDRKIHALGLKDEDILKENGSEEHTSGKLPVRSPIDGIVVERNVIIGQFLEPSFNAFRIINTSSLWADGQIYEKDMAIVKGVKTVKIRCESCPGEEFTGRIIYSGETIDSETRTIKVRAQMTDGCSKLKPEMFCSMIIPSGSGVKRLALPGEAVIKDGSSSFVFVDLGGNSFEKRMVETGINSGKFVEIRKGISQGEKIVTDGTFYLKSEMLKGLFGEEE